MNASELKLFPSREFGTVHVALVKERPYFLASEVGSILEFGNPRQMILKYVAVSDTIKEPIYNHGSGNPNKLLITPDGVKALAARSTAKLASRFLSYMEDTVLPEVGIAKPTLNSKLAELGGKPEMPKPELIESPLNIRTFTNAEFGSIRTMTMAGEPWFVGRDVAERLGYSNTQKAVLVHVDKEDRVLIQKSQFGTLEKDGISNRGLNIINESGLYTLILSSKLEGAKRFKRWVTSEVLPAIRSTGGYIAGEKNMEEDDLIAQALLLVNRKLEMRNQAYTQLERKHEALAAEANALRPKASFAEAVQASPSSIPIGDLAKILRQNGVDIGRNRLMQWLRDKHYLICDRGASFNCPTQFSMEHGWFEVHEYEICRHYDHSQIGHTTYVTGKGQAYFIKKFLSLPDAENP